ncbi:MAG: hypothetical protein LRY55_07485 [Leadbetterella sp.]|nr:hypothetical protein [Leadbetterella sp.]
MQKGILERTGKGIFKIGKNKIFVPELNAKAKSIYNHVQRELPYINFCIWHTDIFNEFTLHHANRHLTLVEVEKDIAEVVFLILREKHKGVFFNPSVAVQENYIFTVPNPVIVRSLISEAPLQKSGDCTTTTLEKMLVDLYCEKDLFSFYQGREMRIIFKAAYEKYTVNHTRMLRYASRRGKRKEIEVYTNQIIGKN